MTETTGNPQEQEKKNSLGKTIQFIWRKYFQFAHRLSSHTYRWVSPIIGTGWREIIAMIANLGGVLGLLALVGFIPATLLNVGQFPFNRFLVAALIVWISATIKVHAPSEGQTSDLRRTILWNKVIEVIPAIVFTSLIYWGLLAISPLLTFTFNLSFGTSSSQIAFVSKRDGNEEIYLMNPDGTEQRNITNHPANDGHPSWSPDGSSISQLTNEPDWDGQASWSPDGSRIAFESKRAGDFEVYVMNIDGSNVRRMTTGTGGYPSWSPDGSRIAFHTNGKDIYVMDANNGSGLTRLTNSSFQSRGLVENNKMTALLAQTEHSGWTRIQHANAFGWILSLAVRSDCKLPTMPDDSPEEEVLRAINADERELMMLRPFFGLVGLDGFFYQFIEEN